VAAPAEDNRTSRCADRRLRKSRSRGSCRSGRQSHRPGPRSARNRVRAPIEIACSYSRSASSSRPSMRAISAETSACLSANVGGKVFRPTRAVLPGAPSRELSPSVLLVGCRARIERRHRQRSIVGVVEELDPDGGGPKYRLRLVGRGRAPRHSRPTGNNILSLTIQIEAADRRHRPSSCASNVVSSNGDPGGGEVRGSPCSFAIQYCWVEMLSAMTRLLGSADEIHRSLRLAPTPRRAGSPRRRRPVMD